MKLCAMSKVSRVPSLSEDEIRKLKGEVGLKYDDNKPDYSLIPPGVLEAIATIMTYGANKYERDNWRLVKPVERYYSALMRHIEAVRKGEWLDKESGYPHMWHVLTNAAFLTILWGEKYEHKMDILVHSDDAYVKYLKALKDRLSGEINKLDEAIKVYDKIK